MDSLLPSHEEVERTPFAVTSFDGSEVSVCWYVPERAIPTPGSAVVYLHGGGMLMGSLDVSDHYVAGHVAESGVPMLSVDYRLAPEHPHPTPVEDCYAALSWLCAKSEQLAVDPGRVAIMGDSAGGGLAAAAALLARDRGLRLAKQILIYPMLDDRNTTPDPQLVPFMLWSYENNELGWTALLGDAVGTTDVPGIAAPARAQDLTDLPSAYVEVGELDIFRDECIEYARRLTLAGTSAELHVWPGCPHGFDRISPTAEVVIRSRADRIRILKSL
jgi:acetyl esterase/lipase